MSGVIDVAVQVDTSTGDDVSKEGKLTDTAVLDLNISKTVELFFISVSNKAKGIEEATASMKGEVRDAQTDRESEKRGMCVG